MKKFSSFLIVGLLMLFHILPTYAVAFSDVDGVATDLKESINVFNAEGLLRGYGDGTFRPQNTISQQEWVRLLDRIASLPEIVSSYSNEPVTRIDAMHLLNTFWHPNLISTHSSFADIDSADQNLLGYLELYGVIHGRQPGYFLPNATLTRAEAAKVLYLARRVVFSTTPISGNTAGQNVVKIIDVSPTTLMLSGTGSVLFTINNHGDPQSGKVYNDDYYASVLSGGVHIISATELGNGLYQLLFRAASSAPADPINIQISVVMGGLFQTSINEYLQNKASAQVGGAQISLAQLVPANVNVGDTSQIIVTPQDLYNHPVSGLNVSAEVTRGSGYILEQPTENPTGSGIYVGTYKAQGQRGSPFEVTVRINDLASRPQTVIRGTVR